MGACSSSGDYDDENQDSGKVPKKDGGTSDVKDASQQKPDQGTIIVPDAPQSDFDRPGMKLTGKVLSPSGTIPISGALVYLTKEEPDGIPDEAYHYECDSMSNMLYTFSEPDGTWTLPHAPYDNWKIVTRKGNFRRIRPLSVTEGMSPTIPDETTSLPGKNSSDLSDRVPNFAVPDSEWDYVYNLLAKFGMGEVNSEGVLVRGTESFDYFPEDSSTPTFLQDLAEIKHYHMVFLPCVNNASVSSDTPEILRNYISLGGRVYGTCYAIRTVHDAFNQYFSGDTRKAYDTRGAILDEDMRKWLQIVLARDPSAVDFLHSYAQISSVSDIPDGHGLPSDDGTVKPKVWVRDLEENPGQPLIITFNYDNGKVFYSTYETSKPERNLTPQEYVLIYLILEVGVCHNLPPPPPVPK